jgi:hypothetical protein
MKRQILPLLFVGMAASLAGCCCPRQVAVVKKTPVLAPTGRVIVKEPAVLPATGPILVKEYRLPPKPVVVTPAEVVVVVDSTAPPKPPESAWYFTGIRWVWLP